MSLQAREQRFNGLCERFQPKSLGSLLADYKIPCRQFESLRLAISYYICRCFPDQQVILDEDGLLDHFAKHREELSNITPNGKIKAKPHLLLEYNLVTRCMVDIIRSLNIDDLVSGFRVPSIRYKPADGEEENQNRPYASEKCHTEAWRGHPENSIIFQIPLLGDTKNNYVKLFATPSAFEDHWACQTDDYAQLVKFSDQYLDVGHVVETSHMYIMDSVSLHHTFREPGAGARVSLEMYALLKEKVGPYQSSMESIHFDAFLEQKDLLQIGSSILFEAENSDVGATLIKNLIKLND